MLQHASSPEPADVVTTLRRCYVNYTDFLFDGEWSSNSPAWCARHCAVKCLSTWLMTSISSGNRWSLRSSSDNMCPVPRTHNSFGDRSFGAVGPRIWNNLPRGLRTFDISYKHLKTLLKTYIFWQATALCDILYKRLRNILTYLPTYLSTCFKEIIPIFRME